MSRGTVIERSALAGASRVAPTGWRMLLPSFVLFQAGWFAAVLGAANGLPWMGPLAAGVVIAWHLFRAADRIREAQLAGIAILLGLGFETVPVALGWVSFPEHSASLAPLWMIALWANFATTLNTTLRNLRPHTLLLAALGGIGGPLAYWGGVKAGAMVWHEPMVMVIWLAMGWALLTPLLGRLAIRLDGYRNAA